MCGIHGPAPAGVWDPPICDRDHPWAPGTCGDLGWGYPRAGPECGVPDPGTTPVGSDGSCSCVRAHRTPPHRRGAPGAPPLPHTFSMRILSLSWTPPSPSCRSANPSGPRPSAAPRGLGTAGRVSGGSRCARPPTATPAPWASPCPRRRPQVQRPLEPAAPERRRRRHVPPRVTCAGTCAVTWGAGGRPQPLFPLVCVSPPQRSSAASPH